VTNANPPPAAPDQPSAEAQRHILQGLLGEHHGLLTTTMNELLAPSARRPSPTDPEMQELFEYLWNAYPGVSVAFGEAQGALNSGTHDEGLEGFGLTGDQLGPKRKGFRYHTSRFYRGLKDVSSRRGFVQAAKHAVRAVKWGNIIAGSLSKELSKIKGMDVILEFGQAVVETLEQVIDGGQEATAAGNNG
jgi:hypothetical protein